MNLVTRVRPSTILLFLFFSVFLIYPLSYVFKSAFYGDGAFTLQFFSLLAKTAHYQTLIINSLTIAIIVTSIATVIAYPFALLLARTKLPSARFITTILLAPLIVPPFVGVIGIKQIFGRFGSVNLLLLETGIASEPINWLGENGYSGVLALQVIHLMPILLLTIRASLLNTHGTLEEAALIAGASPLRTLLNITIPLSAPGWFAGATLVFIASFTDLGTPLMFDYRDVLAVQVFNMLSDIHANQVGYSLIVFTCVLSLSLFIIAKTSFLAGSFSSITKGGESLRTINTSPLSAKIISIILLIYGALACLPQISLTLVAFSQNWFMTVLPEQWALHNIALAFSHPLSARSIVISLGLSILATILTLVLGVLSAHLISRGNRLTSFCVEFLSFIPLAVPGLVFAFGFIGAFSGTFLDNRINPLPLLVCAYSIRRLPTLIRTSIAGFQEANKTLEEAAYVVGATRYQTFRYILFPLLRPHLYVGAILTFAYSMIEVSDSLFLALEERFYPISKAMYALIGRPDGIEVASALGLLVMVLLLLLLFLSHKISGKVTRLMGLVAVLVAHGSTPARAQSDELVLVSPHWEGIRVEFSEAFKSYWLSKTGRDVTFRWLDVGGTSDIVKYVRGEFKRSPEGVGIDLFFGGGSDSFLELERLGLLQPASISPEILKNIPADISGVPLYSPQHLWFANSMSTFGILCNTRALELLHVPAPQTWAALGTPQYKDYISVGDPRKSGSMHAMYEIILQGYGWKQGWAVLYNIAHNARRFTSHASQVGKDVATGDVLCGIAIDTYANDIARQVGRDKVTFILPKDAASVNGDGIAILKGAPNFSVAQSFTEFLLTKRAQSIWYGRAGSKDGPKQYEIGKLSILPAIYDEVEPASLFAKNPFLVKNLIAYDAETASKRWSLLNDLFGTFIIDAHSHLKNLPVNQVPHEPPISETALKELESTRRWGEDPILRAQTIAQWSDSTVRNSPLTLSQRVGKLLPIIGFVGLIVWVIVRRTARLIRKG